MSKKIGPFLDLCVSSLRRVHANLLCIVSILSDVPEGTNPVAAGGFISWCLHPSIGEVVLNFGIPLRQELGSGGRWIPAVRARKPSVKPRGWAVSL